MPNINDAFPSKYLKASDLQGREVVATMDRVEFEAVGQKRETKGVLYFQGKEKGLILNKTNANKITQIVGSALTEDWRGHRLKLYPTETQFGGDVVDCIRVKPANGMAFQMTKNAEKPATRPSQAAPPPPPPSPPPASDWGEDEHDSSTDDEDSIPF